MKTLIAPEVETYAEAHSIPESTICHKLREETIKTMELSQMLVGPLEGAFLKMMSQMVNAQRILEIGTFTGYSALCFAEVLPADGTIITCDIDPDATAIAKKHFAQSPHGSKIDLRLAPALETLNGLSGHFDVIFIDADKINYLNYYQRNLDFISDNGVILIDNVLWSGEVIRHPPGDETTAVIQELNRVVARDPRVSAVLVTIRDGVLIIKPQ